MSTPELFTEDLTLSVPVTFCVQRNANNSHDLVILLHGFQDTAPAFLRRCFLPEQKVPYDLFAPNAPFPAPSRKEKVYHEGYSWFFVDRSQHKVMMPPEVAAAAMADLLDRRGFSQHRKILVGFSQGGYFAPFLARRLTNVLKIIGIGCSYRASDYEGLPVDDVDAIHGDRDEIITIANARKGYEALQPTLKSGEFFTFEGLRHALHDPSRRLLLERIRKKFAEGPAIL